MCAPASPPKMPYSCWSQIAPGPALLDAPRGVAIIGEAVEADRLDLVGVGDVGAVVDRIMVEDQARIALAQGIGDMAGEGRQPAFARQGVADQREPAHRRMPRARGNGFGITGKHLNLEHAVVP